jgi:hypothetical protein
MGTKRLGALYDIRAFGVLLPATEIRPQLDGLDASHIDEFGGRKSDLIGGKMKPRRVAFESWKRRS